MSFWQRMTATLRADAHGVIDALEDRALLLKQHLREAELELQNKTARSQALQAERERRERDAARLDAEAHQHERDAELAIEAGEEPLARYALAQLLSKQQAAQRVAERLQVLAGELRALEATLAQQEPALHELRARVAAYLTNTPRKLPVNRPSSSPDRSRPSSSRSNSCGANASSKPPLRQRQR